MLSVTTQRMSKRGVCSLLLFSSLSSARESSFPASPKSHRKAPATQREPSKQLHILPAESSPFFSFKSCSLLCSLPDFEGTNPKSPVELTFGWRDFNSWVETDLLIGSSRWLIKCGVRAPSRGLPGRALQLALGKAGPWNLDGGLQPSRPESATKTPSSPHQNIFAATSYWRGTDSSLFCAGVSSSHLCQHEPLSYP